MDIYNFLTYLSTDTLAQRRFAADPEGVMAAAGLVPELRAMVANRDLGGLSRAIGGAPWESATSLVDPSYDPPPPDDWDPSDAPPSPEPADNTAVRLSSLR